MTFRLSVSHAIFQALGVETEDDIHSLANYFTMLKEKSRPGTQSRATERTQEQEKEEVG